MNLGMAFQPSEPRKPMAFEGKPFDYNAVLSDLMSKGLKDASPKAHRNLLTDKGERVPLRYIKKSIGRLNVTKISKEQYLTLSI